MPECDVVIVNYNAGRLLSQSVDAVINSLQSVKVFIIDNKSTDQSIELLSSHPNQKVVKREKNHGFAKSCNYGAKLGTSEFICFLNPDCIAEKQTLNGLLNQFSINQKAGLIGCLIKNPDGSEQRAARRRLPTLWRTIKTYLGLEKFSSSLSFLAGVNLSHLPLPKSSIKVEAVSGALMMVRRSAFDEINGFDEAFPMHFEDLDLMKRMIDHKQEIIFEPNAKATHYQGESSKSNPDVEKMKRQGLLRYFKKHGNALSFNLIKVLLKIL